MPSIGIADKTTLDAVKVKTDLIGGPNPTEANTATIMNYLKQLENKVANISGGTDWSMYKPISKIAEESQSARKTLYEVNGSGYISEVLLGKSTNGSADLFLYITIDGVLIYQGRISNNASQTAKGIIAKYFLDADLSTYFLGKTNIGATFSSFPVNDTAAGTQGTNVLLAEPLFFKSNLKIEGQSNASSTTYRYQIIGGIG